MAYGANTLCFHHLVLAKLHNCCDVDSCMSKLVSFYSLIFFFHMLISIFGILTNILFSLAAIRVFRACVGTKDDFYLRNLIKNQVFEPIMRTLLDTQGRDNLLNSSILELLEFIRKENLKLLVSHIVNQFGDTLDSLKYSTVFAQLRTKYDQNVDPDPPTEEPVVGTAK
jgi:uncharacterized membrane protein required for colicin V production